MHKKPIVVFAGLLALLFFAGFGSVILFSNPGIFRKAQASVTPAVYQQKLVTPPATENVHSGWHFPKQI